MKKHYIEHKKFNPAIQKHEVTYLFYYRKWQEDTAYLSEEEFKKIKFEKVENVLHRR